MERIGTPLDCPPCDRAELPEGLRWVRSSVEWDEHTIPAGLLSSHKVASGLWGRIEVRDGRLRFTASTEPRLRVTMGPGDVQAIPPDVDHRVEPLGLVRFCVELMAVVRGEPGRRSLPVVHPEQSDQDSVDEGGDPACWAQLLCPECGAVLEGGICPQAGTHAEMLAPALPPEPELEPSDRPPSGTCTDGAR